MTPMSLYLNLASSGTTSILFDEKTQSEKKSHDPPFKENLNYLESTQRIYESASKLIIKYLLLLLTQ
jgi:hypothetical protein